MSRVSWVHSLSTNLKCKCKIGVKEERSRVTREVSYLVYPGLSKKGNFMGEGDLIPYLVVLLVAVSLGWKYVHQGECLLKWMPQRSKA